MKSTISDQIREYCEEAMVITDRHGPQEGLSYLIGKKFCRVLHSLREAQNKTKFIYPDPLTRSLSDDGQEPEPGYEPAENSGYNELQEEIRSLELLCGEFVVEIKECFEKQDIEDYLNSYPRLAFHREDMISNGPAESPHAVRMDIADILFEVEDIFLVEEIKKLFK